MMLTFQLCLWKIVVIICASVSVGVMLVLYAFEFSCIHPLHRWFSLYVHTI